MGLISDIKDVANVLQKADNIELYKKVLDLQATAMDLVEQINTLKDENKALKERLDIQQNLIFKNSKYWVKQDEETTKGPFCTRCWDVDQKLVYLEDLNSGHYLCPNCKMAPKNENHHERGGGNRNITSFWR